MKHMYLLQELEEKVNYFLILLLPFLVQVVLKMLQLHQKWLVEQKEILHIFIKR